VTWRSATMEDTAARGYAGSGSNSAFAGVFAQLVPPTRAINAKRASEFCTVLPEGNSLFLQQCIKGRF
ncbi:hypothetical protein, partial [Dyadobacter sp.]|uniref:hypothetical protein n=1 Tax=Dyadobacter sp. TaxID=1914288 RepID=UPI003F717DA4